MKHAVRLATQLDVDRIVELGCEFLAGSHYAETTSPDPETMARTISEMVDAQHCLIGLYEADGVVVGMIGVAATIHPFTGQPVVSELFWYVQPEHRGRGTALLRLAERWAMINSAKQIVMVSPNDRVTSFFERRGYKQLETQLIKELH